jgi:hypothetical protein
VFRQTAPVDVMPSRPNGSFPCCRDPPLVGVILLFTIRTCTSNSVHSRTSFSIVWVLMRISMHCPAQKQDVSQAWLGSMGYPVPLRTGHDVPSASPIKPRSSAHLYPTSPSIETSRIFYFVLLSSSPASTRASLLHPRRLQHVAV